MIGIPTSPTVGEPLAVDFARTRDAVLRRLRPFSGAGITVEDTPDGQRISIDQSENSEAPVPRPFRLVAASSGGNPVIKVSDCWWQVGRSLMHHEDMTCPLPSATSVLYAKLSMSSGNITSIDTATPAEWDLRCNNGTWDPDVYPIPLYLVNISGNAILDLRMIGLPIYA